MKSTEKRLQRFQNVQKYPDKRLSLFSLRSFLDKEHCLDLIDLIDVDCRPSTIADTNGDQLYRTSDTTDLNPDHSSIITLEKKIIDLIGLDPATGEPIQGQRYNIGQEFKDHTDYFEPNGNDYEKYCSGCGQRTWTVMVYLNKPKSGGATRFKKLKKTIQPEAGRLLAWNNLRTSGDPNPDTLHHGMKVRNGTKYIVTKWFRQKPWPNG